VISKPKGKNVAESKDSNVEFSQPLITKVYDFYLFWVILFATFKLILLLNNIRNLWFFLLVTANSFSFFKNFFQALMLTYLYSTSRKAEEELSQMLYLHLFPVLKIKLSSLQKPLHPDEEGSARHPFSLFFPDISFPLLHFFLVRQNKFIASPFFLSFFMTVNSSLHLLVRGTPSWKC
jgi:hypothetical protein